MIEQTVIWVECNRFTVVAVAERKRDVCDSRSLVQREKRLWIEVVLGGPILVTSASRIDREQLPSCTAVSTADRGAK